MRYMSIENKLTIKVKIVQILSQQGKIGLCYQFNVAFSNNYFGSVSCENNKFFMFTCTSTMRVHLMNSRDVI